jgi:hypothetical protein
MPAYYWLYNMYALERNSWKYRVRDKRKTIAQRIENDYLAPDTAQEMVAALRLLERWTGKAWYVAEEGGGSLPEHEELERKGRELIQENPELVESLLILGEGMERSKRQVQIIKVVQAWLAYREMLLYYGVKTIASYMATYGIHYEYFAAQVPKDLSLEWINMGGQPVPAGKVDSLRACIRTGLLSSWEDIHAQYETWWAAYPRDRAENAYGVLRYLLGTQDISPDTWGDLCSKALGIRTYIEDQVYITKKKDYTNAFRGITYRNQEEREAVLGKVEDNAFIQIAARETAEFAELMALVSGK